MGTTTVLFYKDSRTANYNTVNVIIKNTRRWQSIFVALKKVAEFIVILICKVYPCGVLKGMTVLEFVSVGKHQKAILNRLRMFGRLRRMKNAYYYPDTSLFLFSFLVCRSAKPLFWLWGNTTRIICPGSSVGLSARLRDMV